MKFVNGLWWPDDEEHLLSQGINYQDKVRDKAMSYCSTFDGVAIDVGAHVGIASLHFAKHFAEVAAIEGDPDTYECLKKNTSSDSNIWLYNTVIGIPGEHVSFHKPDKSNSGHNVPSVTPFSLPCFSLNGLNIDPILIKVDVEGFESKVVQGSLETFLKAEVVILECKGIGFDKDYPMKAIDLLVSSGFIIKDKISHDYVLVNQRK